MSGLFSTLDATVKALNAHSRAIETAGKNLANVNNSSYARQRVVYGDRGTVQTPDGAQSLGLEALGIQQLRDNLLDQQVMREIGLSAADTTEQAAYSRAQAGLGQSVSSSAASTATGSNAASGGLGASLDDFFNAFASLAASPTDSGERQTLIQKATILTDGLQQADLRLGQAQTDLNTQISQDVGSANTLLATIADLNAQIGRIEIGQPGAAVDLRDQRQAKLEELAAYLPVESRPDTNGQIKVVLKDSSNTDIVLVDHASVTGPVTFTGTGLTAGATPTAVQLSSGSVYGALTARDGAIQTLRDRLDALASQLVTSVNGAYNPTATPGADFFDPTGTTAGTIAVRSGLTATTVVAGTGAAGDNSIALAVAALASTPFSTASGDAVDGTMSQHYSKAVTELGQALATANTRASDQTNIATLVKTQRDGVSGVSLDEEMADLVRFQRAFQASSRVFTIVDDLLDTVVNRLGN